MLNQLRECKILLDSSVLLQIYEGIDVFELINQEVGKCGYYVLDCIIKELNKISTNSKGFKGRAARLALDYLGKRDVEVITTDLCDLRGDESIIQFFKMNPTARNSFIVATNDGGLKKELLKLGVKVLTWWSSKFRYVVLTP